MLSYLVCQSFLDGLRGSFCQSSYQHIFSCQRFPAHLTESFTGIACTSSRNEARITNLNGHGADGNGIKVHQLLPHNLHCVVLVTSRIHRTSTYPNGRNVVRT